MDNDFLGTGWSFPPQFSKAVDNVRMVSSEENVRNSLQIILGTKAKERFTHPDFGCNLSDAQFSPMSTDTQMDMESLLREAISAYEHRVKVDGLHIDSSAISEGRLDIVLSYTIIDTNTKDNLVYPYYL